MLLAVLSIVIGILVLVWSADRFVDGSAAIARHLGLSPLLIGMVIVGFGTSVPEMLVSAIASFQGTPGIALGNAYGSNITNIALILGLTAIIKPVTVRSRVLRKELPILTGVTAFAMLLMLDEKLTRVEACLLLGVFSVLMAWSYWESKVDRCDILGKEMDDVMKASPVSPRPALIRLFSGLLLLMVSSRMLVWGAVEIAHGFGVSDLIIGLTIVAVGTSLPEMASSLAASRRGENDIALGNIIGSNLFNTLVVVGIAGIIKPMSVERAIVTRDMPVMAIITLSLLFFGFGFRGRIGRINRIEGAILLTSFIIYSLYLISSVLSNQS